MNRYDAMQIFTGIYKKDYILIILYQRIEEISK